MAEERVPKCPVCGGIDLVKKKRPGQLQQAYLP